MKTLHPSEDHWMDYVAGQMDAASRVLLEAHLAFCNACRDQAQAQSAPGAQVLDQPEAEAASPELLQGVLSKLRAPAAPTVGLEALPLPRSLWPLFPDLRQAQWRGALTRGFRFLEIPQPSAPPLYLIHMERGRPFPRHGHRGLERSLILRGGLQDEGAILEAGDFDETEEGRTHAPIALPDEDCWLLASLGAGIRFTGWRGWLQAMASN